MSANISYTVNTNESILSSIDGTVCDNLRWDEPSCGTDFSTLAEAIAWATAQASSDKLEIVTDTRYGNGTVTRNVYEICAFAEDEDGEIVPCSYDGELWEDNNNEVVDVLDLHLEVRKAWERANKSLCSWLDYEDCGEGFVGFREALEDVLGEDWDELDYIDWR